MNQKIEIEEIIKKIRIELEKITINEQLEIPDVLEDLSHVFIESFRLIQEYRDGNQAMFPNSEQTKIYNSLSVPGFGNPKKEILMFLQNELSGCSHVEIYDPYFFQAYFDKRVIYLDYMKEIAKTLSLLKIEGVTVHYKSSKNKVKVEVEEIFRQNQINIMSEKKFEKLLHDRIWIGSCEKSEPVGITFGSSFNQLFNKPMLYSSLPLKDTKDYQQALISALKELDK